MPWRARKFEIANRRLENRPRAAWAAVLFALASLIVDLSGWVRTDLKPLMEVARQNSESLKRIESKLEDHERRIQVLERRR